MVLRSSDLSSPRLGGAALALLAFALGCAAERPGARDGKASRGELEEGLASVRPERILEHIRELASDAFEGRAPGSPGETKTVEYLEAQFRRLGLAPGNPDGTFVQEVPLVGMRAAAKADLVVGSQRITLRVPDDAVILSRRPEPATEVRDSEVVFVGYGVMAPEYGWDDYKGVDLRGKTVLMLVNDPPVRDPKDPSKLDDAIFKGRAMTYYGRWTYKYEIASKLGAAAVLIIHETGPAGYPYDVVRSSWAKENFDLGDPDAGKDRVLLEGWISGERAQALFSATGHDLESLRKAAIDRSFRPIVLGAKATLSAMMTRRPLTSRNVLARLEGRDPALSGEVVVYSAHWDHLGKNPGAGPGTDAIYNGALDNGSGLAEMLAIAEAFTKVRPPRRSIVFLAPTGEESGLLGARYYATHPLYPLERTLADINLDVMNLWGRTKSVVSVGLGTSTLDAVLEAAAARQGRAVRPDPEPEKGYFYRSDHFELMKRGVPALHFLHPGADYLGRAASYGQDRRDAYAAHDYHQVTDEVKPDWDLRGAVDDVRLLFEAGYAVADGDVFPEWKPGTEFKAIREESLRRAAPAAAPSR